MLIEEIVGRLENTDTGDREIDFVILDHMDLIRPHQKVKTQRGRELAISLSHGEQLFKGAVLHADEKEIIAVDLAMEDVFQIIPKGNIEWARVGFNIGNMHQAAYVSETDICIPYDPVIEKMLHSLNVEYSRKTRKLDGIRANASIASAGHYHTHEQAHNHSHSHEQEDHHHGE
jgi:urease accessory protein